MNREIERWRNFKPDVVSKASYTMILSALIDAQHDIIELQAEKEKARQAALEEAAQIAFETENQAAMDGANLSGESGAFSAGMEHAANMIQAQINARISGVGLRASQQPHAVDLASLRSPNH